MRSVQLADGTSVKIPDGVSIRDFKEQREVQRTLSTPRNPFSALASGFTTGIVGGTGSALSAAGALTGFDTTAFDRGVSKFLAPYGPRFDEHNLFDRTVFGVGAGLGSLAPSIAAGLASAPAGGAAGVAVAGFSMAGLMEGGAMRTESLRMGKDESVANSEAILYGIGSGLLNAFALGKVLRAGGTGIFGRISPKAFKALQKGEESFITGLSRGKRKALSVFEAATAESITESLEEPLADVIQGTPWTMDTVKRMAAVALPSFIVGGGVRSFQGVDYTPGEIKIMEAAAAAQEKELNVTNLTLEELNALTAEGGALTSTITKERKDELLKEYQDRNEVSSSLMTTDEIDGIFAPTKNKGTARSRTVKERLLARQRATGKKLAYDQIPAVIAGLNANENKLTPGDQKKQDAGEKITRKPRTFSDEAELRILLGEDLIEDPFGKGFTEQERKELISIMPGADQELRLAFIEGIMRKSLQGTGTSLRQLLDLHFEGAGSFANIQHFEEFAEKVSNIAAGEVGSTPQSAAALMNKEVKSVMDIIPGDSISTRVLISKLKNRRKISKEEIAELEESLPGNKVTKRELDRILNNAQVSEDVSRAVLEGNLTRDVIIGPGGRMTTTMLTSTGEVVATTTSDTIIDENNAVAEEEKQEGIVEDQVRASIIGGTYSLRTREDINPESLPARELTPKEAKRVRLGGTKEITNPDAARAMRFLVGAFTASNFSTSIHEFTHFIADTVGMNPNSPIAALMQKGNRLHRAVKDWTPKDHENFAEDFERFLLKGHSPTGSAFSDDIMQWVREEMTKVYKGTKRMTEEMQNPEMRNVYEMLLGNYNPAGQTEAQETAAAEDTLFDKGLKAAAAPAKTAKAPKEDIQAEEAQDKQEVPSEKAEEPEISSVPEDDENLTLDELSDKIDDRVDEERLGREQSPVTLDSFLELSERTDLTPKQRENALMQLGSREEMLFRELLTMSEKELRELPPYIYMSKSKSNIVEFPYKDEMADNVLTYLEYAIEGRYDNKEASNRLLRKLREQSPVTIDDNPEHRTDIDWSAQGYSLLEDPNTVNSLLSKSSITSDEYIALSFVLDSLKGNTGLLPSGMKDRYDEWIGIRDAVEKHLNNADFTGSEAELNALKSLKAHKDAEELLRLMKLREDPEMRKIIDENPEQAARFLEKMRKHPVRTAVGSIYLSVFYNSLLSNPSTSFTNIIGNTLFQFHLAGNRVLQGMIDTAWSAVTGNSRSVFISEGGKLMKAWYTPSSLANAWKAGRKAFVKGEIDPGVRIALDDAMNVLERRTLEREATKHFGTNGKKVARAMTAPTRFLVATDMFFRSVAETGQKAALAERFRKMGPERRVAEERKFIRQQLVGTRIPDGVDKDGNPEFKEIKADVQLSRLTGDRVLEGITYTKTNKKGVEKKVNVITRKKATEEQKAKGEEGRVVGYHGLQQLTDADIARQQEQLFDAAIEANIAAYAAHATFQDSLGKILKSFESMRNDLGPIARVTVPFLRTVANITKRGLEMTPVVGVVAQKKLLGSSYSGVPLLDTPGLQLAASQMEGAMITFFVWGAVAEGVLTGPPPEDKSEREAFFRRGMKAESIKVGENWVSYRRFDPFSLPFSMMTSLFQDWKNAEDDRTAEDAFFRAASIAKDLIIDGSYLRGVRDSIGGEERDMRKTLPWIAAGVIPYSGFWRFWNNIGAVRASDSIPLTKNETFMDSFGKSLPSQVLPLLGISPAEPRIDVFGQPVVRPSDWFQEWTPFQYQREEHDPVESALQAVDFYPGMPGQHRVVDGVKVEISDQIYSELIVNSGRRTKTIYRRMISSPMWNSRSEQSKHKEFRDTHRNVISQEWRKLLPRAQKEYRLSLRK